MTTYDQIQPSVFVGAAQWLALHSYATTYTDTPENRRAAKQYIDAIAILFPCERCRGHFNATLKKWPIENYLDNNSRFFLWTWIAHDQATISKGEVSPPYNEVKRFYFESLLGGCDKCDDTRK